MSLAGASNNSDGVVAEENAAELPKFLKIRRRRLNKELQGEWSKHLLNIAAPLFFELLPICHVNM